MLDTRFPRPPGDVGHPDSWSVPTEFLVVEGIGPQDAVQTALGLRASRALRAFSDAARKLEQRGVAAITTSCGFLVLLQFELQRAVAVPVVTSSLLQLPALLEEEAQVGVLTISAERLGAEHLGQAGVPPDRLADVRVQGVAPGSEFARAILGNHPQMDLEQARCDVVAAAIALKQREPDLRTVVLECTNMPPYADLIREATGWRVLALADSPVLRRCLGMDRDSDTP
ncbi:MAG: hypothetical protein JWQ07_3451 [Ramlibacter sp.]|nr:hypothetical protein [Ramlibacter sp.]